ncbi:hypothetical protein H8356DRAFT_1430826 [Neocallimastix lanati (nom. inval.)]|nr:hypothetical protein H8356DRAFT_1430826 [Neocallimastix sp. JGI-2020a]
MLIENKTKKTLKNTEDFGLPHIVIWVKETPYRSTLRDPRGKAEPTIGAGHCKSSQTRLTQWDSNSVRNIENLERKNREDMILVGVDPETFELDDFVFSDSNKLTLFITKVFGYRPGNNSSAFNVSTHEGAGTFQALANKELTSPKANWASGL